MWVSPVSQWRFVPDCHPSDQWKYGTMDGCHLKTARIFEQRMTVSFREATAQRCNLRSMCGLGRFWGSFGFLIFALRWSFGVHARECEQVQRLQLLPKRQTGGLPKKHRVGQATNPRLKSHKVCQPIRTRQALWAIDLSGRVQQESRTIRTGDQMHRHGWRGFQTARPTRRPKRR